MRLPRCLSSAKESWLFRIALIGYCFCQSTTSAQAASGTWINANGGSWTNSANWSGGVIADGTANAANFNTLSLSADVTVTLDASRTIGTVVFDDQSSTKHNWLLSPGGANTLTLSAGTPTINVGNATTRIDPVIAGTSGLSKSGAGRLVLTAANTYSGTTAVTAGTLSFATASFSAPS